MDTQLTRTVNPEPSTPSLAGRPGKPRPLAVGGNDVSFVDLWHVLLKRRIVIVISTSGMFLLALLYTLSITPRYRSVSIIEFNKANTDTLALEEDHGHLTDANAVDYTVTQQTQVAALQSDTLALQVLQELRLDTSKEFSRRLFPVDYIRYSPSEYDLPIEKATYRRARVLRAYHKNLKVEPVAGTRMISVQFLHSNPETAAQIVNRLTADYIEQYFRIRYSATVQASDWLSKQLDDLKRRAESSQQELVDYQKQVGFLGSDETHNLVMTHLEAVDNQLTTAEANRILAQTVWQLARTGNPELLSGLVNASVGSTGMTTGNSLALIQELRSQQSQIKVQYAEAASKYGSSYPKLIELQNEMNQINENIKSEVSNLGGRAETDFLAAQLTEKRLREEFEKAKEEANQQNDRTVRYALLKREAESSRDLFDGLSKKLKEAGVLASLRSSNIVIVDPARASDHPARPILPLNLGLGLFAGLFLGVAGAFFAENIDETICSPEQAEQVAHLPSLGFIPLWKRSASARKDLRGRDNVVSGGDVLVSSHPHSQPAEAFRALRTSILQTMRQGQCNVVLVTSPVPGEGKTTTSINLSAALAQQRKRVLLVEADMRRPSVCSRLNLSSSSSGLSSMIAGEAATDIPVKSVALPSLAVIPAGRRPSFSSELLGSDAMGNLISAWRKEYDFVVIDAPPVLSVTDAVVLAPLCDGVLLVLRSGVSTKKSLLRVTEIILRGGSRIIGTLLNGFQVESTEYSKYLGYDSRSQSGVAYYTDRY